MFSWYAGAERYLVPVQLLLAMVGMGATLRPQDFGLVFQKGNTLRTCVNRALSRLWRNGTIKRHQNTYLAKAGAPDLK